MRKRDKVIFARLEKQEEMNEAILQRLSDMLAVMVAIGKVVEQIRDEPPE